MKNTTYESPDSVIVFVQVDKNLLSNPGDSSSSGENMHVPDEEEPW